MDATLEEVCSRIIRKLGPDQRECVYAKAVSVELQARGHHVTLEYPVPIFYTPSDGHPCYLGTERADIVVDNKCVLEIKIANNVTEIALTQARRYATTLALNSAYVLAFSRLGQITIQQIVL